jgi:hypothetical protein
MIACLGHLQIFGFHELCKNISCLEVLHLRVDQDDHVMRNIFKSVKVSHWFLLISCLLIDVKRIDLVEALFLIKILVLHAQIRFVDSIQSYIIQ